MITLEDIEILQKALDEAEEVANDDGCCTLRFSPDTPNCQALRILKRLRKEVAEALPK